MRRKEIPFTTLLLTIVLLSSLIGELQRFHGYLLLDLIAPLALVAWGIHRLVRKKSVIFPVTLPFAVAFLGIGFGSLLVHSSTMNFSDFLSAALYGVRWATLFGLSVLVYNEKTENRALHWKILGLFTLLLCLAGFLQLIFVPDFSPYEELGWDPHEGRLLSTWFDPNFIGGFLAFITPAFLGRAWDHVRERHFLIPTILLGITALALTLSRSAYLAFLVGMAVFTILRSFKLAAAGVLLLVILGLSVPPVQDRFLSLIESMQAALQNTYTLPDASARLRYASWEEGWELFLESPWIGHGYNRYKYAALELGTLKDLEIHSASGSDSSLLNILAGTGLLGFLPYMSIYMIFLWTAWTHRKDSTQLGILSGLLALFVHSIFVNSLLFPLLMAPVWMVLGELPIQTIFSKKQTPSPAQ